MSHHDEEYLRKHPQLRPQTNVDDYIRAHPDEFKRVSFRMDQAAIGADDSRGELHLKTCAKGTYNPSTHEPFERCTCGGARSWVIKKMQDDNMRTWQEQACLDEHGTENQRGRYADGLLPEDELLTIARAILFKGFGEFARWATSHDREKMTKALKHHKDCRVADYAHVAELEFETCDVNELDAKEYDRLKQIRDMVNAASLHPWLVRARKAITVELATHWVTCKRCEAELARTSVKVTIPWAGRPLTREYAL